MRKFPCISIDWHDSVLSDSISVRRAKVFGKYVMLSTPFPELAVECLKNTDAFTICSNSFSEKLTKKEGRNLKFVSPKWTLGKIQIGLFWHPAKDFHPAQKWLRRFFIHSK